MNFKLFTYYLLLITCYLLLVPTFTPVDAHVLKTDGNIGAVLHINPDDDPIADQQTGFFFEFKDKQNKFTPQSCTCTFSVEEDGKTIFSQPLFQNNASPSLENASVFFTFPERNVYQIKVAGSPTTPGAFQKFSLTYDVRVARQSSNPSPNSNGSQPSQGPNWFVTHIPHLIAGLIIGLFLLAAFVKQIKKPKTL